LEAGNSEPVLELTGRYANVTAYKYNMVSIYRHLFLYLDSNVYIWKYFSEANMPYNIMLYA